MFGLVAVVELLVSTGMPLSNCKRDRMTSNGYTINQDDTPAIHADGILINHSVYPPTLLLSRLLLVVLLLLKLLVGLLLVVDRILLEGTLISVVSFNSRRDRNILFTS